MPIGTEFVKSAQAARLSPGRLVAASGVERGDAAAVTEEQTFRSIVSAVAQLMQTKQNEADYNFSKKAWRDSLTYQWLYSIEATVVAARVAAKLPGNADPFTEAPHWTRSYWKQQGAKLAESWNIGKVTGSKNAANAAVYKAVVAKVNQWQKEYEAECQYEYGRCRDNGRDGRVQLAGGRSAGVTRDCPHWVTAYDALNFTSPDLLNVTLGQARADAQGRAGEAYGAASSYMQDQAAGIAAAAAGAKGRLDAANAGPPKPAPPSGVPAGTGQTGTQTTATAPSNTLLYLGIAAAAVAVFLLMGD
jgi:hypothetical protein